MIKAFLKSGILTEAGASDATETGTPQGGILSPLLANIAQSVKAKVRTATRHGLHQSLAVLLYRLAPILWGWTTYFRHGVSKATFDYLRRFTWRRVLLWIRRKHRRANWKWILRHYLPGWVAAGRGRRAVRPGLVTVSRYRYRGNIPTPWSTPAAA